MGKVNSVRVKTFYFKRIYKDNSSCYTNALCLEGCKVYKNNLEIIDDSYNANPKSVKLAIDRFNNIKVDGKKIFIMGDMLELGDKDIMKHKEISKFINDSKINIFLTYGKLSKSTFNDVTNNIVHDDNMEQNRKIAWALKRFTYRGPSGSYWYHPEFQATLPYPT